MSKRIENLTRPTRCLSVQTLLHKVLKDITGFSDFKLCSCGSRSHSFGQKVAYSPDYHAQPLGSVWGQQQRGRDGPTESCQATYRITSVPPVVLGGHVKAVADHIVVSNGSVYVPLDRRTKNREPVNLP